MDLAKYQEYLEELLAAGGKPDLMEALVAEYNAVGNPDFKPEDSRLYRKWAGLPELSPEAERLLKEGLEDAANGRMREYVP